MAQVVTPEPGLREAGFGSTDRKDNWWVGPLLTFLGLLAFVVYTTWAGLVGNYFEVRADRAHFSGPEVAPYLSPFYSPLLYDAQSPHAWIHQAKPSWWPAGLPFSAAVLILAGPGLFRFTCYYYRKAYYRSFWADPPGCAVGEPRKSYWGENHWPLLLQNLHRYFMYVATIFLIFLWWDALTAFRWPTNRQGQLLHQFYNLAGLGVASDGRAVSTLVPAGVGHQFGMGLGTLIMLANVVLLTGFTLGCNSVRHLVGGRLNSFACFTCANGKTQANEQLRTGYRAWRLSTWFNEHHMEWAWLSLFSVGFTDLYIRLCAMGVWNDPRFF